MFKPVKEFSSNNKSFNFGNENKEDGTSPVKLLRFNNKYSKDVGNITSLDNKVPVKSLESKSNKINDFICSNISDESVPVRRECFKLKSVNLVREEYSIGIGPGVKSVSAINKYSNSDTSPNDVGISPTKDVEVISRCCNVFFMDNSALTGKVPRKFLLSCNAKNVTLDSTLEVVSGKAVIFVPCRSNTSRFLILSLSSE
mmetsp:Transcript_27302/g.30202  ORF Transcript_27302/g.30202 Transcript_27302/m.30202 type:complete len:200 (+) Transcript_27302:324-923(+)